MWGRYFLFRNGMTSCFVTINAISTDRSSQGHRGCDTLETCNKVWRRQKHRNSQRSHQSTEINIIVRCATAKEAISCHINELYFRPWIDKNDNTITQVVNHNVGHPVRLGEFRVHPYRSLINSLHFLRSMHGLLNITKLSKVLTVSNLYFPHLTHLRELLILI